MIAQIEVLMEYVDDPDSWFNRDMSRAINKLDGDATTVAWRYLTTSPGEHWKPHDGKGFVETDPRFALLSKLSKAFMETRPDLLPMENLKQWAIVHNESLSRSEFAAAGSIIEMFEATE